MYDVIKRGGRILDGTGNSRFYGGIGIRNGKTSRIGELPSDMAKKVIDARGFIDMHSHSDFALLINLLTLRVRLSRSNNRRSWELWLLLFRKKPLTAHQVMK